jgi:hypothetical protein
MTTHDPPTKGGGDRPNCSFCRSDVEQRAAEMDRQRHREQLDAFDLDVLGLVDRAERLGTLLAEQAAGRVGA